MQVECCTGCVVHLCKAALAARTCGCYLALPPLKTCSFEPFKCMCVAHISMGTCDPVGSTLAWSVKHAEHASACSGM